VLVNSQLESMFGYARAELIGAPLEMLVPDRLRASHSVHRRAFAAEPGMRWMGAGRDLTARRKDGTEFPVEIGLNPVSGEEGGVVFATVSDITRRKKVEQELEQAHTSLEEFTYAASHDLKSPLRGIAELVEWIGDDLGSAATPGVARNLGRVGDRVRRLEQLIDDLLKYARAGAVHAEAVTVSPRALVAGILELQPVPAGYRIAVHDKADPFVTRKTPLETALRNVISNAIKHHDRPNGNIEIHIESVGHYCVFTVIDDGPGIPVAAQERVFKAFQTLAPITAGTSGIGLALSKRLVEAHGGRITVSSTEGARGAKFRIWWPRTASQGEP
jgi:PAS domain S-box-containing protein